MTRGLAVAVAVILAVGASLIGFGAWASSRLEGGFGGTVWIWVAMIGGALTVAALTGGLMWLAFFSARAGFDDAVAEQRDADGAP